MPIFPSPRTNLSPPQPQLERQNSKGKRKKIMQDQQLHTFDRKEDFSPGSWRYRDDAKSLVLKGIFKSNCVFNPKNQWERTMTTMMIRILRKNNKNMDTTKTNRGSAEFGKNQQDNHRCR